MSGGTERRRFRVTGRLAPGPDFAQALWVIGLTLAACVCAALRWSSP